MRRLFAQLRPAHHLRRLGPEVFAKQAAHLRADLHALHLFWDDDGRTQLTFIAVAGDQADLPLDLDGLRPSPFSEAIVATSHGDGAALAAGLCEVIDGSGASPADPAW